MSLLSIPEAIEQIRNGRPVVLVDDENRENEGDLTIAAEFITPEWINFMVTHCRGLICLTLSKEIADALDLPPQTTANTAQFQTAFTVSIEAKQGVTTGISAFDRAHTILTAVADNARPEDLARPGHIFPIRAKEGGVMVRAGQTEGSVDLARLAGLKSASVICEIMNSDGSMARMPQLEEFNRKHNIGICTIADLIEYRLKTESFVHRVAEATVPTAIAGEFKAIVYENDVDSLLHFVMMKGEINPDVPTLVRVHSECLTGDIFGSERCDCGNQLHWSMKQMEAENSGVLLYLRQEGRGIGLVNKIKAYALQEKGLDTVEANMELGFKADLRNYGIGAQILANLGVRKIKLLTNNPKKIAGLTGYGLEIVEQIPIEMPATEHNKNYLSCKQEKLGHLLHVFSDK